MADIKRAALYVRVSTHDQEELSPDAQKRLLLDYAKNNLMDVDPEYIFIDGGISGRKAEKRPEFVRMIGCAKEKPRPFDVILVWKFSRFARNQEESIVYKSMLQKQCGVDVVSISEPLVDGPFGSLIERIIEWMDEYYSIRLSGEVKRGMTEKAMRGGYQSAPPIGYVMENGVPVIHQDEAVFVRRVFELFLSGYDISSTTRKVNSEGYLTRRGNSWEARTIKYLLSNPYYIGKVRWNRASHGSHILNDASEIIIRDGVHDPIISPEDFAAAQERIVKTSKPYAPRSASGCGHWLSGCLKCSVCGSSLGFQIARIHTDGRKRNAFFQCINYSKSKHDGSQMIMASAAESLTIAGLIRDLETGNINFERRTKNDVSAESRIQAELIKCLDREKRCKRAYTEGIDTLEEYRENKAQIQKLRAKLEEELSQLKQEDDIEKDREELRRRIGTVLEVLKSNADREVKNSALKSIIARIVWDKQNRSLNLFYYI